MGKRKIGLLHLDVYKGEDGTFTADLTPEYTPVDKHDFVKLALLAAEMKNHLTEQLHVINVDEDGQINQLAEMYVESMPDEVLEGKQTQLKLDFKERTG